MSVVKRHARRELLQFRRQQRGRPAEHDVRAEFRKQIHVRARHAAVRDVADDRHAQPFELRSAIQNGAGVEQRLRGMLVRAVAGVDDRNLADAAAENAARPKPRAA